MDIRQNWRILNNNLHALTEAEVHELLQDEMANKRRQSVLVRLHQRFNALRGDRERLELMKLARTP